METQTKQSVDVYDIVTDRIIEQLHAGTVPWRKPWTDRGIPTNLISKRPYRGINIMLLNTLGYEHNLFLTYRQLKAVGGSVNQNEKPHPVIYLDFDDEENDSSDSSQQKRGRLRYYKVYNITQCNSVPENLAILATAGSVAKPECESVITGMKNGPTIQFKESSAYYNPMQDILNMPKQSRFESAAAYYATFFHELVHSTGHHSRLNRKDLVQMSEFGSEPYSHEELVAEIGSCYLQSVTGIQEPFEQSAAYIDGWLAKLEHDKRFIYSAATHAQRAADYILNISTKPTESGDAEE